MKYEIIICQTKVVEYKGRSALANRNKHICCEESTDQKMMSPKTFATGSEESNRKNKMVIEIVFKNSDL